MALKDLELCWMMCAGTQLLVKFAELVVVFVNKTRTSSNLHSVRVCCVRAIDVALKEEANKKAFEKFAKESSSNCSIDTVQVSERYESECP